MVKPFIAFIGGPFTGVLDPTTGLVESTHRCRYERLMRIFLGQGWSIFNAHHAEAWGAALAAAEDCTRRDLDWMRTCDLFVAFPGHPASPGTHVEIGWASALAKPTVLLLEPDQTHASLAVGLAPLAPVTYVTYSERPDLAATLFAAANKVAEKSGARWRLTDPAILSPA